MTTLTKFLNVNLVMNIHIMQEFICSHLPKKCSLQLLKAEISSNEKTQKTNLVLETTKWVKI